VLLTESAMRYVGNGD